ncbi:ribosome-assembly protein 3 domain-containing protein [Hirsutella rhossiliensis]|uniref:Ribosome assembly protein 3 n=1 Tax=Hirsutella rhossiliensis TaxID=111463 RepID=A0A9P8SGL8_9HYPO|nr:ribosome-assembly protein 3 domain-containing protein [Hirsutella rhossiliensis]KAH0960081.1 ribosome-assembly protein 3 domain-containing protein [Hirsutella rhossiliensis]
MPSASGRDDGAEADFSSYYLERATHELSEDLDKVRNAEDFKLDSVSFLVHSLRQGAAQFSTQDQKRVVAHLAQSKSST